MTPTNQQGEQKNLMTDEELEERILMIISGCLDWYTGEDAAISAKKWDELTGKLIFFFKKYHYAIPKY